MSILNTNPFQDPRAADSLNGKAYVRCFSPFLVAHLPEVFAQGNVILRGTIGCGKSMILRLFDPKVKIAYFEEGVEFPVPKSQQMFIATGVNLSKSGVLDIVQRMPSGATNEDVQRLTAIFVDYLNYWLVNDLLDSCEQMIRKRECFEDVIDTARVDDFVAAVVKEDCWFGYLSECTTLKAVRERIDKRLNHLRSWANWNIDSLDKEVEQSKSAIGEPVACSVVCMKRSGLLASDSVAFVRIDQVEELLHKDPPQYQLTEEFRRHIYRALGRRDGRVSYRIGTRNYDSEILSMPGGRKLEESRDYVIRDFDAVLRRGENPKDWLFKGFADDVFSRRLSAALPDGLPPYSSKRSLCRQFFGASPSPQVLVGHIIVKQDTTVEALINVTDLSASWKNYIRAVYDRRTGLSRSLPSDSSSRIDPLNAALACAWAKQNGGHLGQPPRHETERPPKLEDKAPWTVWWQKERVSLAILQLAASHKQKLIWWGTEDVLALSSNNITLFLSICRETWELWLRDLRSETSLPGFGEVPLTVQRVAIENISKRWHQNLSKQPGRPGGDVRIRFLDRVFADLRIRLRNDEAMRYPGANGFSVLLDEVAQFPELKRLLDECVAWGDLECVEHTSKNPADKIRGRRFKYYANSILVPHYQIYQAHTKEPRYVRPEELLKHALSAKALPGAGESRRRTPEQPELNLD
ncbi:MAG: hypothetical protein J0M24_09835 [Verrucomicrobia bacterium]|nr:hypothetical protein [Verrucomicrobiota bacterium]